MGKKPNLSATKDRIRFVRNLHRLSQEQFAEALNVKRGAVGNWELGKGIDRKNLELIAEKFGVSLDWLALNIGHAPYFAAHQDYDHFD